MSDEHEPDPLDGRPQQPASAGPATQQMRTVGQRRRDAERKLEHHLDEARHKNEHPPSPDPEKDPGTAPGGAVDAAGIASIQNDDQLAAADRVNLIANQAIPESEKDK
jgi:hypothetical protein